MMLTDSGLPCHLGSGWVWPMESMSGQLEGEKKVRSGCVFRCSLPIELSLVGSGERVIP